MEKKVSTVFVLLSLVSIVIFIVTQLVSQLIFLIPMNQSLGNVIYGLIAFLSAYYLLKLYSTKVMKKELSFFRIGKFKLDPIWVAVAFVLPIVVSAVLISFPGTFINNKLPLNLKINAITGAVFAVGLGAGVVEELLFRGILMTALEKRWNKVIAILIPSILFAVLHVYVRQLDFVSFIFLLVAGTSVGVLFSLVTIASGSIWNSAIIHGLWNAIIVGGVISIGTELKPNALYSYILDSKSMYITGGDFGIESSVIALIGYILFIVIAVIVIKGKKELPIEEVNSEEEK